MSDEQVEAVQRALGLGPAAEPSVAGEPEREAPAAASAQPDDTQPEQADAHLAPVVAVGREQQTDTTDWFALGVPPPRSAADKRQAERIFIEQLHRPRT